MTKVGLYIVIIAIALNNLQLAQFAKLPVLFEHFKEHRHKDCNITMFRFLAMHYWGRDINDNDDSRDQQLPFKVQTISNFSPCYIPPMYPIKAPSPVSFEIHNSVRALPIFYPDAVLSALFRPPQA